MIRVSNSFACKKRRMRMRLHLHQMGPLVRERRGERGIREVAADIGISPATLSRVERGKLPDLDTFSKLCRWLQVDPAEVLGVEHGSSRKRASVKGATSIQ